MTVSESRFVIGPGDHDEVWLGGVGVRFMIPGAMTGGAFSVVEHPVRAGSLVMPHVHAGEDELSCVVDGAIGVRVGDEVAEVPAGGYVFKPRGVPHTFWNAGPGEARLIEIISPAGFERYFVEMGEMFEGSGPDPLRIAQIASRYQLTYRMDWIDDITSKYGVALAGREPPQV